MTYSLLHPPVINPWYIIASVAFCASNRTEEVPRVFQYALEELQAEDDAVDNHRLLARKMRDALFKAGMVAGYARVGYALRPL